MISRQIVKSIRNRICTEYKLCFIIVIRITKNVEKWSELDYVKWKLTLILNYRNLNRKVIQFESSRRLMTSTMVELQTFLTDEQLHGKLDKHFLVKYRLKWKRSFFAYTLMSYWADICLGITASEFRPIKFQKSK